MIFAILPGDILKRIPLMIFTNVIAKISSKHLKKNLKALGKLKKGYFNLCEFWD